MHDVVGFMNLGLILPSAIRPDHANIRSSQKGTPTRTVTVNSASYEPPAKHTQSTSRYWKEEREEESVITRRQAAYPTSSLPCAIA